MPTNSRIPEPMLELAGAFRRISEAFAPHRDGRIEERLRDRLEALVEKELLLLYRCCYALARDLITVRTFGPFSAYDFNGSDEVDDAACEAMLKLFGRRSGRTGALAIVGVVDSLCERNAAAEHDDILRWLRGAVTNQVNNLALTRLAERNPQYVKTARKVERYVRNSGRYVLEHSIVRPARDASPPAEVHMPHAGEIIALCGYYRPLPTNVPAAVDLIFELLSEEPRYRSAVRLAALREAVFALLEARLCERPQEQSPVTPYEAFLVGHAEEIARAVLADKKRSYVWRGNFTNEEKNAFIKAGEDYLFDLVYRGAATCSERNYLAAHIDGCTSARYASRHKGSFHNFLQSIEMSWRKRMGGG